MREAGRPLTSAEIAAAVMQAKEMPSDDAAFKEIVAARTLTVLRRLAITHKSINLIQTKRRRHPAGRCSKKKFTGREKP
jgi:hypothetical protein